MSCFFTSLCYILAILLIKMTLKNSAEVLSSVPSTKAVMCLTEKAHGLGKPPSGMSDSSVDCHFSVNESTIRYLQRREGEIPQCVCEAAESAKARSRVQEGATAKAEKQLRLVS